MTNRQLRRVQERSKPGAQKQKERAAAQRKKKATDKKKGESVGIWKKITQFLRDVRIEMKKVIWPSRQEVINYTIVVLITVTIVSTFILVLDLILSKLLQLIT